MPGNTERALNQERGVKLEPERQRLQLALREVNPPAFSSRANGLRRRYPADHQPDRGLVMTLGDVLFDTGDTQSCQLGSAPCAKVQFL